MTARRVSYGSYGMLRGELTGNAQVGLGGLLHGALLGDLWPCRERCFT